jgi:hypothetical protein
LQLTFSNTAVRYVFEYLDALFGCGFSTLCPVAGSLAIGLERSIYFGPYLSKPSPARFVTVAVNGSRQSELASERFKRFHHSSRVNGIGNH